MFCQKRKFGGAIARFRNYYIRLQIQIAIILRSLL